jgi:hypothetical protein
MNTRFVIVRIRADGSERSIWMFGLTGDRPHQAALIVDGGESYELGGYPMGPSVYPEAQVVGRIEMSLPDWW